MRNYTSLLAWQLADDLAARVYNFSTTRWTPASSAVWDQARRASLSTMLNLVEGYAWRPGAKWRHHLRIAFGSASETTAAIQFMVRIKLLNKQEAEILIRLARRTEGLIWGLLKAERPLTPHP